MSLPNQQRDRPPCCAFLGPAELHQILGRQIPFVVVAAAVEELQNAAAESLVVVAEEEEEEPQTLAAEVVVRQSSAEMLVAEGIRFQTPVSVAAAAEPMK